MVGQIYDYDVKNYKVPKIKGETPFLRDFPIYCAAIVLIFLLSFELIYINGKIRQIDSSIAASTKELATLNQQHTELLTQYQKMTSLAKLESYAKEFGLRPVDFSQVRFISSEELTGTEKIMLALKQKKETFTTNR